MKLTVLSPHRDDAAFSVGLSIGTWISAGHQVEVVNCFTKSSYSPFGDLEYVHVNDLHSYVTALRHREDVRWSRKYERPVSLLDLNLRDAPQRLKCTVEEVCSAAPRMDDPSIERIRKALAKTVEGALLLPLGIGDHVDHLTARVAGQGGWPNSLPIAFYEDLPYAAREGMSSGIEGRVGSVESGLRQGFAHEGNDERGAVNRKRDLALCYDSQIDSQVTEQIAQFCERYHGRERLWVNGAWQDSGLGVTR